MIEDAYYKTFSMNPKAKELSLYLKKNFSNGNYFSAYEAGFCGYGVQVKDIYRNKSRIKSFLYRHGIEVPFELATASKYWSSNLTTWLREVKLSTDFGHTIILGILDTVTLLRVRLLYVQKELRRISNQEEYVQQVKWLTGIPA
ncbi:hypothetical protein SAMN04487911_11114 [Arenibacter nanhaiticus]|uniref:Uncharacterized protein n=1 Tax=Arenibacter nanhaiticus TaxID=558155 RepID=A0A1M6GHE6_9FLAO|nr:hypothetical protein [Arenibacter nanhaiticus]SHJ09313.1 hypothetical protein SAMN04487911_11114 [Arenibacter nanhaiticus]